MLRTGDSQPRGQFGPTGRRATETPMRFLLLLFTTGLACAGFSSALAAPIPTGPIHTANSRFRIPFRFDAAEMRRLGAREIRLFVSEDRGRT